MNPILRTQSLCAGYKSHHVLGPLNMFIPEGSMTGIKARNGTGKTTLLKTLAGIIPPTSGQVLISDKNLRDISISERASLVSIVFTDRVRLNGITVKQLVSMGSASYTGFFSFFKKENEHDSNRALHALGIDELSSKPLSQLSDGELQKAMIARALAQGSRLMLMDEPTAFLDYIAKEELFLLLKKLVKETRITVLFTSHDIALMKKYADEILTL